MLAIDAALRLLAGEGSDTANSISVTAAAAPSWRARAAHTFSGPFPLGPSRLVGGPLPVQLGDQVPGGMPAAATRRDCATMALTEAVRSREFLVYV